ncbi:hypothetical protein CRI94_09325 [Longibacter salinarum]|uniref:Uncharacterized protein n=1 Tax=Longibacter salinarum TaxID=1850348 RepID=A0A2A8CXX5_9BACT|nr:hypothetical protein [Longibacter salinarum]PEN13506.1 hypothetical protein CRI94_09325 [Longibacter salinarum]
MRRADIRTSIDFRGLIRGCPDHQWQIVDAIRETQSDVSQNRWLVTTEERIRRVSRGKAAPQVQETGRIERETIVVVRDRWTGWEAQGTSPEDVAKSILTAYSSESEWPLEDRGDGSDGRGQLAINAAQIVSYPSATD